MTMLPFDLEVALAHPERVRFVDASGVVACYRAARVELYRSASSDDLVLVWWEPGDLPVAYPRAGSGLRLVPGADSPPFVHESCSFSLERFLAGDRPYYVRNGWPAYVERYDGSCFFGWVRQPPGNWVEFRWDRRGAHASPAVEQRAFDLVHLGDAHVEVDAEKKQVRVVRVLSDDAARSLGYGFPRRPFSVGDVVRHVRSGFDYVVVGAPPDLRLDKTGEPAYVYRGFGGFTRRWVCSAAEMEDGRFVLVSPSSSSPTTKNQGV